MPVVSAFFAQMDSMYVSPIIVLLSVCDRQPEREAESLAKLNAHVRLFFRTFNIDGGEK